MSEMEKKIEGSKDGWEDVLGSGQLFRKVVICPDVETDVKPKRHDKVVVRLVEKLTDDTVVGSYDSLEFYVGHAEVVGGVEICVQLMTLGELDLLRIPSRLAYGKRGRDSEIPPDATLLCEVELLEIQPGLEPRDLGNPERLQMGEEKRLRGNYYYVREEYHQAVPVYQLALEYLDMSAVDDATMAQSISEAIVKVHNNLAATQLKLAAWDAAASSLRECLRLEPANPKALFRVAKAESGKGEYRAALHSLRKALQADPESILIAREIEKVRQMISAENKRDQQLYKKMMSGEPKKATSWALKDFMASKLGLASGFTCATAIALAAFYMRSSRS